MTSEVLALNAFNVPLQTILIPKNGASFLKVLFYYLDQFKLPDDPASLENGHGLNFQRPMPIVHHIEGARFVFYRHPLDRLIAFYYDDLFYVTGGKWHDWRRALQEKGAQFEKTCSTKQHQKNVEILLEHIQNMTTSSGMLNLPDPLAPQYKFLLPAIDLGFEPFDLVRANFELEHLLAPFVDDSVKLLKKIEDLVRPINTHDVGEIVTRNALSMHRKIYEGDFELYWAYRDGAA